jgi:choline dehydrogenase-like flavoprotein
MDPFYDEEGALAASQHIRVDLRTRRINRHTLSRLWRAVRGCRDWAPEVYRRYVQGARPRGDPHRFVLFARAEQAPNPSSRVTLSDSVDQLGMRRSCLDWRTIPLDRKSVRLMARLASREFERLGFGQVIGADWLAGEDWPADLVGGPHHMGTTRMADDPSCGVVDRNCKVFHHDGLYVAGSSVFPTGGHANPTLSILALAIRLADHLKAVLAHNARTFQLPSALRLKSGDPVAAPSPIERGPTPERLPEGKEVN